MKFIIILLLILSCKDKDSNKHVELKKIDKTKNIVVKKEEKFTGRTSKINVHNDKKIDTVLVVNLNKIGYVLKLTVGENDKRLLLVQKKGITKNTINILSQDGENWAFGFSLRWIKEIDNGFEISIDYGSRMYHHKDFQFIHESNTFYLKKIKITTFDKFHPEKFYDTVEVLKKPLNIDDFKMKDFITP
jgi:long-subunit fatty acid transport protein